MLEYCPSSSMRYFKPMVSRLGLNILRLTPSKTNEGTVPLSNQAELGDAILANHQCITQKGQSLLGGCQGLGGQVVGGHKVTSSCPSYFPADGECYAANNDNKAPVYEEKFRFHTLKWQNEVQGVKQIQLVPGSKATLVEAEVKGLERPEQLPRVQAFDYMRIDDKPATIDLNTVPPEVVQVGIPFVMKVTVRISSGALLANTQVTVELAPAKGALMSAIDFIKTQFGLIDPMVSDDPPKLDAQTITAVTDKYGVARFAIVLERGPPSEERKLFFKAGEVKSQTTRVLTIINPVNLVTPTQGFTYTRKGIEAIGSVWTEKVRVKGMKPETFPVLLRLPDAEVHVRSATIAGRTVPPRAIARGLELRTFSIADLEKMRKKRQNAQEAMGALIDEAQQFRNSAAAASIVDAGMAANELALTSDDPLQALSEFTPPVNASAVMDYAKQNGKAVLEQFVKLLMSGTNPLTTDPTGASRTAEIWTEEDFWFGSGDIDGQDDIEDDASASKPIAPFTAIAVHAFNTTLNDANGSIVIGITDLRIVVRAPGTYKLQPIVSGIAGPFLQGEIVIEKFDKNSATAMLLEYAFRIGAVACVAATALGASDFHRAQVFVPFSLLWIMALGLVLMLDDGPVSYPVGEYFEIGTWWTVVLVAIAWATLTGVAGLVFRKGKSCFKPFALKRRDAYFAYCKSLVKRPSTEVGRLQALLASKEARSELTLTEKFDLEKQIQLARARERSYVLTIKKIIASALGYGQETAFFFPQRIYGAFVVSAFAVAFMCVGVWNWCISYRVSIEQLDVRATSAMYSMVRVLQKQFFALTGEDLPSDATDWATDNAFKLHGHIVSLSLSVANGVIGGMSIGYAFFLASWGFHFLEFRSQVLRARRGEWDFNWRKTSTVLVVTFVGTAISNALFVFLFTCVLFTPIMIVFSWSVVWEYLAYTMFNTTFLVLLLIVPCVQFVIKFAVRHCIFKDRHTIRYRYLFMAYDMYEVLATCVAGIAKSIVRMILVIITSLLTLPRIDRSPFPDWLEYYFLLDSGSKSFHGMIKLYHWHNHPVMRVAAWIMQEDADERRKSELKGAKLKGTLASPVLRRVSNRWWKLWVMYKTPSLTAYSSRSSGKIMAAHVRAKEAILEGSMGESIAALEEATQALETTRPAPTPAMVAPAAEDEMSPSVRQEISTLQARIGNLFSPHGQEPVEGQGTPALATKKSGTQSHRNETSSSGWFHIVKGKGGDAGAVSA